MPKGISKQEPTKHKHRVGEPLSKPPPARVTKAGLAIMKVREALERMAKVAARAPVKVVKAQEVSWLW